MSVNRRVEQFAFEVVRQVLGVAVEEFDVGPKQAAVDGLIHYPGGLTAALEVSSIGPEPEARIVNSLDGRSRREVSGLRHTWFAEVPRDFHPADLARIDDVVLRCQESGLRSFRGNKRTDGPEIAGVHAWTSGNVGDAGPAIYVLVRGIWGWTETGASDLQDELAAELAGATMQSKIAKLRATGLAECHLFLYVRPTAFSFPVFDVLGFGGSLPASTPSLPAGISQVWLLTGWKAGGVVRAVAGEQWLRHEIGEHTTTTTR